MLTSEDTTSPRVSIILRTKNEEKWLKACVLGIEQQDFTAYEIILVDNNSEDGTVSLARHLGIRKIRGISEYTPGAALNLGVAAAEGEICVFLSAHCVPADGAWLSSLIAPIINGTVAATYGRQIPTSLSNADNSRDLLMTFGSESFTQALDIKFHNANSAVLTSLLRKCPFDEHISNIEDWLWSKNLIGTGAQIMYQAKSRVFHHHGINQHADENLSFRAKNVSKLLSELYAISNDNEPFFNYINWCTLLIVSKANQKEFESVLERYPDLSAVLVNASDISSVDDGIKSFSISQDVGFHEFLREVLVRSEAEYNKMFDSIVFLDFTFSKVDLEAVELNLTELYSHWADICAVARRITGKTFILDGSESMTHRGKIFPSFRSDSSSVELIMGQGCAVRSWVLRAPTHSDISYRISSFIEHDLAHKRHH